MEGKKKKKPEATGCQHSKCDESSDMSFLGCIGKYAYACIKFKGN